MVAHQGAWSSVSVKHTHNTFLCGQPRQPGARREYVSTERVSACLFQAYRPCPALIASGGTYKRKGQDIDEVLFGSNAKN